MEKRISKQELEKIYGVNRKNNRRLGKESQFTYDSDFPLQEVR